MRTALIGGRPTTLALAVFLTASIWMSATAPGTAAGAAKVQRYPFDPRYSQVACAEEKPPAAPSDATIPPDTASLLAAARGHFLGSVTCSWGYLVVLTPGSEALAGQLRARFGRAVKVFIGPDPAKPSWSCW